MIGFQSVKAKMKMTTEWSSGMPSDGPNERPTRVNAIYSNHLPILWITSPGLQRKNQRNKKALQIEQHLFNVALLFVIITMMTLSRMRTITTTTKEMMGLPEPMQMLMIFVFVLATWQRVSHR